MNSSEPVKLLSPSSNSLSSTGLLAENRNRDSAASAASASVQLRGTRRSYGGIPRLNEGIRGRVRLPEPRKDGSRAYLKQWVLTAAPLLLTDLLVLISA